MTGRGVPDDPPAGEPPPGASGMSSNGAAEEPQVRSGLRNPVASVRGVGAGALAIEAIVLLMAIVPLIKLGGRPVGWVVTVVLALAAGCVVLAGLLRYRWAWYGGIVLQVALFASGLVHVALAVLGLLFGAVWGYVLTVRRSVLGRL